MSEGAAPLILTLGFDAASFAVFDGLRRAHFPAGLNKIPAHLTLFHHLPGTRLDDVMAEVARQAAMTPVFSVQVNGLRKLGRGVAFTIVSPELIALRARLAHTFADDLIPQDRQGFRPHVTIQNKVTPAAANLLFEQMGEWFTPWTATAEALLLWHYRGGPWEAAGRFNLEKSPS